MQRQRLLNRLCEYSRQSLVFIHAAAGYGKTTLMLQLSDLLMSQGCSVHWLTLDADDNDPIRLYQYLWLSFFSSEQTHLDQSGLEKLPPVLDSVITKHHVIGLMEKLAQSSQQHVLLIDEFEVLDNNDCVNLIWWMYQYLPENVHLVISSRIKPNWSLSKEIVQGRLHVVNADQLSITSEDTTELIEFLQRQNFEHVELSSRLAELLIEKTEGWITGIQLINLYLKRGQDLDRVIQNLSGAQHQIVDYLSEQVFLRLSEEIQLFLLQMSVLRRVNQPLVQTVTNHPNAQRILEQIQQRGLFIQALDEQRVWYRIHHLFRDFLQNRFKALYLEEFKRAHSKAAHWYKENHFLMEAIYHAQQADDQVLVLELLTAVSRELVLEGRVYTLLELVKQLPEKVLVQHIHLLYDVIWSLLLTHQNHLASYYLKLWHSVEASQHVLLRDDQLGLAPMIALLEDNLDYAHILAQQNLEKLPETAYFTRGPLIGIGALHHICMGNVSEARQLLIQTRVTYIQGYNLYGLVFTDCVDATFERLLGNLTLAEEKFNLIGKGADYQKLGVEEEHRIAVDAITSSLKADLYYEMNQVETAELILRSFNGGDQLVIPDMVIIGYVLLLRLAHLRGDRIGEQTCLTQSQIRTSHWSLPRLAKTVQKVHEHLDHPNKQSHIVVDELNTHLNDQKDDQHSSFGGLKPLNITNLLIGDDLLAYSDLIFDRQSRSIETALAGLNAESERAAVYPLRQIRIQLLQALAYHQLGQQKQAFQYLEQALLSVMSTRAVRIFLDEHPAIWTVLGQFSQYMNEQRPEQVQLMKYIESLRMLMPSDTQLSEESSAVTTDHQSHDKNARKEQHPQIIQEDHVNHTELLSKREIQILQKVSEGLSDAEIAEVVFLSVNTVKWHLRNIYNKLNARSRLEAVNEAKERGLMV